MLCGDGDSRVADQGLGGCPAGVMLRPQRARCLAKAFIVAGSVRVGRDAREGGMAASTRTGGQVGENGLHPETLPRAEGPNECLFEIYMLV